MTTFDRMNVIGTQIGIDVMTGMTVIAEAMINIGMMTIKSKMTIVGTTSIMIVEGEDTRIGVPRPIEVGKLKH